jgi:hypothetical protein
MRVLSAKKLRERINLSLRKQGYRVRGSKVSLPPNPTKDDYRSLNALAIAKKLAVSGPGVKRHESRLQEYIANGSEVVPEKVQPKVVLVRPETEHELLFRYACLHWSIPVSAGYGRRLRFLVLDKSNGKLIGLFGLGDPVYAMKARDDWIGWDREAKKERLYHVMDAYVLGAVPPYSSLLCGKLVAMLALSNEVRRAFRRKYGGHVSLISQQVRPPHLALLTTTSALGRSSIYNRIRLNGFDYWQSVGFTSGWGDFHFSNGVYHYIRAYAEMRCKATAKHDAWGDGFRNKREVVRKCLAKIGLSTNLQCHGIRREIFVAPLGGEAARFLKCEVNRPGSYDWPAADLAEAFKERWLLPRAERKPEYREFRREEYRLWAEQGGQQ